MLLYLQMNPDSNIFMFGQHDNSNPCTCQGCLDAMQEYGGTYSGLQIDFFNELGSPGGAQKTGVQDYDDPMIAALPPQNEEWKAENL